MEEIFFHEALEQVAQRGGKCPTSKNIQSQVGWDSKQPGLVEDIPAYGRGVGLKTFKRSL